MSTEITLVTHNRNKLAEFRSILEPEIMIEHMDLEYPELRSDDEEDVVRLAAKQLADLAGKMVVVEDSGFHINALSGFPGTCTAYTSKRVGNKGLLKLMKGERDRRVFYKSAIGICKPGGKPIVFTGLERGRMAHKERGSKGWGQDPIFTPEGSRRTYGESRSKGDVNIFRKQALMKLRRHLLKR